MKAAIIGLPGSGKSTLFNLLTGPQFKQMESAKYRLGTVRVKDSRLDRLAEVFHPEKITYVEIVFIDTYLLDLNKAKEADVLVLVLGLFMGRDVLKDINEIFTNISIIDLEIIERRLQRLKKEIESKKDLHLVRENKLLLLCKETLNSNKELRQLGLNPDEIKLLSGFQFLSQKPIFFIANCNEDGLKRDLSPDVEEFVKKKGLEIIKVNTKLEEEVMELPEKERADFIEEYGLNGLSADNIVQMVFKISNVISFFTVKGKENRAWAVEKGTTALDAAGKVHSDIKRGFVKAEVIGYDDFIKYSDFNEAKKAGLLRLEGKDYIVQDGDIINFKFNV